MNKIQDLGQGAHQSVPPRPRRMKYAKEAWLVESAPNLAGMLTSIKLRVQKTKDQGITVCLLRIYWAALTVFLGSVVVKGLVVVVHPVRAESAPIIVRSVIIREYSIWILGIGICNSDRRHYAY